MHPPHADVQCHAEAASELYHQRVHLVSGESRNVGRHETYAERLADMVQLWRKEWGTGRIAFLLCRNSAVRPMEVPSKKAAYLREAQFRAQSLIRTVV